MPPDGCTTSIEQHTEDKPTYKGREHAKDVDSSPHPEYENEVCAIPDSVIQSSSKPILSGADQPNKDKLPSDCFDYSQASLAATTTKLDRDATSIEADGGETFTQTAEDIFDAYFDYNYFDYNRYLAGRGFS